MFESLNLGKKAVLTHVARHPPIMLRDGRPKQVEEGIQTIGFPGLSPLGFLEASRKQAVGFLRFYYHDSKFLIINFFLYNVNPTGSVSLENTVTTGAQRNEGGSGCSECDWIGR